MYCLAQATSLTRFLPSSTKSGRLAKASMTALPMPLELPEPADHFQRNWAPRPAGTVTKMGMQAVLKALRSRGTGKSDKSPQVSIPARFSIWPAFLGVNSAIVTTPDGDSVSWFRRDSKLYRRNMLQCFRLTCKLMKNWKRLSREYREYGIASMETWEHIFRDA